MKKEKADKKPFIILLAISVLLVVFILTIEKGSVILFQSKYEDINKIVINAEYTDVEVKMLDSKYTSVQIHGKKSDFYQTTNVNGTLTIAKDSTKAFCLINCSDKIVLYLPKEFNTLDITLETGEITTHETLINEIYIKNGIGKVNLDKVKSTDIDINIGDVTINEIDGYKDSYIKVDTGDIKVKKTKNFNITGSSNVGKVNIKEYKDNKYYLNAEVNIADINIK